MTDPALVTLHVWGVPSRRVPAAVLRMATGRRALRPGVGRPAFAKLLGTGHGQTFGPGDADPRHWALLATWESSHAADRFESAPTIKSWDRLARERLRVRLRPLSSRGRWSGRAPFGDPAPRPYDGPVAALTRARLAPRHLRTFWRSVPPVAADLGRRAGLRLAIGVGEAPLGFQGTFSLWDSAAALQDFAYTGAAHAAVVGRTPEVGWYSEQLFARFALESVQGTYEGRVP